MSPTVDRLRAAVLAADEPRAQSVLGTLLRERGNQHSKLTDGKAWRAESFRVEGDSVLFQIERHPGLSFLTHRVQTWKVTPQGDFVLVREAVERITFEVLAAHATREDRSPRSATAEAAVDYARELGKDDGTEDPEDIAIGWVATATWGRRPYGRFPGTVADMARAIDDGSGCQAATELLAEAGAIAARARELWAALRTAKEE